MIDYPKIVDAENDRQIVLLLRNLAFGREGEMTSISTYSFQHFIVADENISRVLEEISLVEMRHLELISEAIVAFGGVPYFANSRNIFWSSRNVNYETDPRIFLKQNLKNEREAVLEYEYLITKTNNESLKQLIRQIIEDEKEHARMLNELIENL